MGVIGTSGYAQEMHLTGLQGHPQARLAAICGRRRERAEVLAAEYNIPNVYTDYQRMIEAGGLDAVVAATPDDLHYEMVMTALDAGLHVLCEKPLALNAGQAREMFERAEAKDVVHMTYFTWRWRPHLRYLKTSCQVSLVS